MFQRQLAIPNIEEKSRDELLKIFHSYAMPLHKRSSARTKSNEPQYMDTMELAPTEQFNKSGNKRIIYETNIDNSKSMDLVTNGCKRIKIGAISDNKRGLQDLKVDSTFSQKTKRQKITWP